MNFDCFLVKFFSQRQILNFSLYRFCLKDGALDGSLLQMDDGAVAYVAQKPCFSFMTLTTDGKAMF